MATLKSVLLSLAVLGPLHAWPAVPGPGAPGARDSIAARQFPRLGFALNCHHISDLPRYLESIDRIAGLGANALLVVTPMFQERVDSTCIGFRPDKCATDEQLTTILRRARDRGLHTTLVPIVLLASPGPDDWRGTLNPGDWDQWWASYEQMLDRFIDLAANAQVDVLSIGSELNTTQAQVDHWRRIIAAVRSRFPGRVTYCANWDRYEQVAFWPLVDEISISAYFEVGRAAPEPTGPSGAEAPDATTASTTGAAPSRAITPDATTMALAWIGPRDVLLAFASGLGKPLILAEVGYPSLPWAGAQPWNYVAPAGTKADAEAQARCYEALFDAWHDAITDSDGPLLGIQLYHWDPYHAGGPNDTGYGVDGKPALPIIQAAFAQAAGPGPVAD